MAVTRHSSFDITVNTIVDRNALLRKVNHMTVLVKDAIADVDAGAGAATYRWDASDEIWVLISKSTTETISFDTEELTITNGKVTPSNIILDNKIWNVDIVNGSLIVAQPRMEDLIIDYTGISGLEDYNGLKLRFTYAYGSITAQIKSLITDLETKIDNFSASDTALALKVDKVAGKSLSTEDYSTAEKTKLAGIAASANNYSLPVASASVLGGVKAGTNVSIDANGVISANDSSVAWSEVTSKPTFATVATSGSYVDLSNKPTIPTTLPASDVYAWAKASAKPSYAYSEITGTPTIPTVPTKVSSFTNDSGYQTSAQVNTAIQAVVGAAPDALNTLAEIATQLANDESAVSALTTTVSGKATKATTLNGYGITDAYTKAEVGTLAELTAILG